MTGVEMIKLLKSNGYNHIRINGSHYHYKINGNNFPVPHHHSELSKRIENQILKYAGLK
ncbi:MAG: type II toxin-antitoxin system HicA family toxin [Oscillospiraceae bacterium]|nr:type II toxin-antitoxin system HicA family toxin [Oscillospiraceae bacterium]